MTEEIIIDGVNVSECCCYEKGKCLWTKRYYENNIVPDCEKVKGCYYKQLKQAEIEIEKLKAEIRQKKMTIMMNNDHYLTVDENNRKYRSALEEIRKIAKDLKQTKIPFCTIEEKIQNIINEVL